MRLVRMALFDPPMSMGGAASLEQVLRVVTIERACETCGTPNRWWSDARNPRCAECRRPMGLP